MGSESPLPFGEGKGDHNLIRVLAKGQQLGWAPCRAPGDTEAVRTGKVKIIQDSQFKRAISISTKSGGLVSRSSSEKKQVILRKGRIQCGRGVQKGRERNGISENFLEYPLTFIVFI